MRNRRSQIFCIVTVKDRKNLKIVDINFPQIINGNNLLALIDEAAAAGKDKLRKQWVKVATCVAADDLQGLCDMYLLEVYEKSTGERIF